MLTVHVGQIHRDGAVSDKAGVLEVLNVGSGHLTLTFNKDDRPELERAKRVVSEMLARGYAIFVEIAGQLRPVRRFDAKTATYYITDVGKPSLVNPPVEGAPPGCRRCGRPRHKGRCRKAEIAVPMVQARATAVGRSAGG